MDLSSWPAMSGLDPNTLMSNTFSKICFSPSSLQLANWVKRFYLAVVIDGLAQVLPHVPPFVRLEAYVAVMEEPRCHRLGDVPVRVSEALHIEDSHQLSCLDLAIRLAPYPQLFAHVLIEFAFVGSRWWRKRALLIMLCVTRVCPKDS